MVLAGTLLACADLTPAYASETLPIGSVASADMATLKRLLDQPEDRIDLAQAKVAIDRMVDPAVDAEATLRQLEQWHAKAAARIPIGASSKTTIQILLSTLYEPGPWNDFRPFGYDYSDPYGKNLHNALLSTYLDRRKGQCIIMPIALALLGQKLGLPMTLTMAPNHLLVKYGDEEQGTWMNIDATSGLIHPDGAYEDVMKIPHAALEHGTYLRPFTQRESVALLATAVLVPHYLQQGRIETALQATDLILAANPLDVAAMTLKENAYIMLVNEKFRSKYPQPEQIPAAQQPEFLALNRQIIAWRSKADALGRKEWTPQDWDEYLKVFAKQKAQQQGS